MFFSRNLAGETNRTMKIRHSSGTYFRSSNRARTCLAVPGQIIQPPIMLAYIKRAYPRLSGVALGILILFEISVHHTFTVLTILTFDHWIQPLDSTIYMASLIQDFQHCFQVIILLLRVVSLSSLENKSILLLHYTCRYS